MEKSGDGIKAQNANWKFSGEMVENFEAHVAKSVPLYYEGHDLVVNLSDYFVKEDSTCYELGSSAGTLSHKLALKHDFRNANFIGLEIEQDMVDKADATYQSPHLSFEQADMTTYDFKPADLMISYYTVQFIHPKLRQTLINNIYNSLNWGGAFILYEKVRANDARFQDIISTLYMEYKLNQGYDEKEVVSKAKSLKGVLEPFSTQGNIDMLKRAGFEDIISIQKYMNFEGFLAIK